MRRLTKLDAVQLAMEDMMSGKSGTFMEPVLVLLLVLVIGLFPGIYIVASYQKRHKPAEPEPEPEPEQPAAESVIAPPPPDYGNIRPVVGEETDPEVLGPDIHDFPDMPPPATRYEDFNRRLFIVSPQVPESTPWPKTTADDFPTKLPKTAIPELLYSIRRRLRPQYPVIYDGYGYWAQASYQLEQNPFYTDDFVEAYLAIPEGQRPVVVSVATYDRNGHFRFMRYGFVDYVLTTDRLRLYVQDCLRLIMAAMIGPREDWLWFSVARMRQTVIRAAEESAARKRESEAAAYMDEQIVMGRKKAEQANRFLALWKSRLPAKPDDAALAVPAPQSEEGAAS